MLIFLPVRMFPHLQLWASDDMGKGVLDWHLQCMIDIDIAAVDRNYHDFDNVGGTGDLHDLMDYHYKFYTEEV